MTPPVGQIEFVPPTWTIAPFAVLLLAIAVAPLVPACRKFWHANRNKLIVSLTMSLPVLLYYWLGHPLTIGRGPDAVQVASRLDVVAHVLHEAVLVEYVPFMLLLFALYTISGGIVVRADLKAHPLTNTAILAVGAVLANFIGTTGAAMLLIRPLIRTNSERRHVRHTIIFFIFLVCNVGGCLLPTADPPLFLGYLSGVSFLWTLRLLPQWAFCSGLLLAIYYVWDSLAYRRETPSDIARDERAVQPLSVSGKINLLYLALVVAAVGLLVPGQKLPGTPFVVPHYLREIVMLSLAATSWLTTARAVHKANHFTFAAIGEVAALFLGIFITMQAPIEILRLKGGELGLAHPWQFFWATGALSGFLDNAPTYMVFFETANSLTAGPGAGIVNLSGGQFIRADLLAAVSLGAVFMGAMTYIGNGPNFMVKAIAEHRGIRMPGFFAYMIYSTLVLIPVFGLVTLIFLR